MNRQKVFDKVVVNRLWNKAPLSLSPREDLGIGGIGCRYRGPNGEKCDIGFLIDDEHYIPLMEGNNILGLLRSDLLIHDGHQQLLNEHLEVENPDDAQFLNDLQRVHDGTYQAIAGVVRLTSDRDIIYEAARPHLREGYREVAKTWDLTFGIFQ